MDFIRIKNIKNEYSGGFMINFIQLHLKAINMLTNHKNIKEKDTKNYINIEKSDFREHLFIMFVGAFIGGTIFLLIYGVNILDFTYIDWLINGEDLSQHYIGWAYFRNSRWGFPIGMIEGITDIPISIIYMDSIPLMALIFKLLSGVLPNHFQYFGLWGILSFALTGAFSSLLIRKFTNCKLCCWIGSVNFIISPYILQRMFAHTSLGGQWIIILAILIWVNNWGDEIIIKKVFIWSGTLCVASLIHLYFVPMIVVFIFADAIKISLKDKNIFHGVFVFIFPIMLTLLVLFCLGAFDGISDFAIFGLGYYSANMNTLINPNFGQSFFLKTLSCYEGQNEGMGYLGAGIIILCIIDFYILVSHCEEFGEKIKSRKVKFILSLFICLVFFVLALSPTITFGKNIIYSIVWPEFIRKILEIFRASGRFIWPICYLIYTTAIGIICKKENNKTVIIILSLLSIIQVVDLSPYILSKHEEFAYENEKVEINEAWDIICNDKEKIIFIPYDLVYENTKITYGLGEIALENSIKFNFFYIARHDSKKMDLLMDEYISNLKNDIIDDKFIYIFKDIELLNESKINLNFYLVDGIIMGVKDRIKEIEQIPGVEKLMMY